MMVAPEPIAVEEGLAILRAGGNAIDAAVAAAFVQGIVDPHMCGIGGAGVMLVHTARNRATSVIEFYARAGSRVRSDQWEDLFISEAADRYGYVLEGHVNDIGYQSVAIPGAIAGFDEALRRFGTISWSQALQPAIRHAREGFALTGHVREYWMAERPGELANIERLRASPESARIYLKDGAV
ncbi:MAG: gamma-glutamyltransferase, partial [Acidimicrobiales bacterium]